MLLPSISSLWLISTPLWLWVNVFFLLGIALRSIDVVLCGFLALRFPLTLGSIVLLK